MLKDWDSKLLGGSLKRGIVNPDLLDERKKCTFDQDELARFILTDYNYTFLKEMQALIKEHPDLIENSMDIYDMTRSEKMEVAWRRIHRLMLLKPDLFLNNDPKRTFRWDYNFVGSTTSPVYLH
jgi:hypothetical protein